VKPPDATALARSLADDATTSVALTEDALSRIAAQDSQVRAFISVTADRAIAAAAASDARRVSGASFGLLDGVPFAVKDNIAVKGVPRTSGTAAFSAPSEADATVVARLCDAGAVLLGTLNMHEGALGASTDNPHWGACQNPLQAGFAPGGSSGGSAAAIAAGMVPMTLGTDTLGSVRIPAAYCGLWGLKPTNGRVPVTGLAHLSWTLDTIGPLARSPEDLAALMEALEGPDVNDRTGVVLPVPSDLPLSLSDLTLGVPDYEALAECEPMVVDSFKQLMTALETAGAVLRPITVQGWVPGALRRAGLLVSEVEGAEIFGGVMDGPGLSEPFRAMLDYGRNAGAPRLARAYRQLQVLAVAFENAMARLDGLLLPTAPQRAFAHGGNTPVNQADFTALANVAGAPAITMPLAAGDGGLPVAAQIVGPRHHDHRLIAMGQLMQSLSPLSDWHDRSGSDNA
jgi:aspartyl-tRNA(Asn)/glutamyl-tRNA(Gln) amidotransferase subunit A